MREKNGRERGQELKGSYSKFKAGMLI